MNNCGDSLIVKQDLFQSQVSGANPTSPLQMIYPKNILIKQVSIGVIVKLQKVGSKAIWRPAAGRKLGFLVFHNDLLLGWICLASPVINLEVRDKFLKLPKKEKGKELRKYMDMCGCVGVQPISWHWNIGKLLALIAPTLGDFIKNRYPNDEFKGIITTSLWGKSIQYNRVYKFLGYTKGYGHEHISDENYKNMILWMRQNNIEVPSCKFGAGSNARMRRIAAYKKASNNKEITLIHGHKRGVYYHEAIDSSLRKEIINFWYNRWGLPRYEKTKFKNPPYKTGVDYAPKTIERG